MPSPEPTPNKTFFESNPTSKQLRTVTLQGANALKELLRGNPEAVSPLMDASQQLRQLGLIAGMHTIEKDDPRTAEKQQALKANPVMAAEWVGGQLLKLLERPDAFEIPEGSIIAEHDKLLGEGEGFVMFDPRTADPRLQEYCKRMDFIGLIRSHLDAEAQE